MDILEEDMVFFVYYFNIFSAPQQQYSYYPTTMEQYYQQQVQGAVQQNPYPQTQYPQTTFVIIVLCNKIIFLSVPSAASPQTSYGHSDRTLWIGNLHQDVSEIDLRQNFENFGNIENVKVFF
jgi:hypothetical protein